MSYLKGIEAGANIVDTAISALASGTAQPPTESLVAALKDSPFDTGLDLSLLSEIAEHFKLVRKKYKRFETVYTGVNAKTLIVQVPGGMISNLALQLKEQNALDRMNEVLEEIPKVRKDMGYPPLVTPSSQVVGTQATLNILTGERYKVITSETRNYFKGLYGTPPGKINPQARKKAVGGEKTITCRPADLLEPELDRLTREVDGKARSVEDVLTYALFPMVAMEFFEQREAGKLEPEPLEELAEGASPAIPFHLDDRLEEVMLESLTEVIPTTAGQIEAESITKSVRPKAKKPGDVTSSVPGKVTSIKVSVGDQVSEGDTVLTVEAMKMENEVHTPISGTVKRILVKIGDSVNPDETLVEVEKE
jgi:pyruvate carboxylase subunit B